MQDTYPHIGGWSKVHIALASLAAAWEQKEPNLERCRTLCAQAAALGAELVAFPEMTLTGFTMAAAAAAEAPTDSWTIRSFADCARAAGVAVAFGVVLRTSARPVNCLVLVDSTGAERARYAKIHPFSHAAEDAHYDSGGALAAAPVAGMTLGFSVCYDLRFPELYTALAPACAALLVIANWPAARIAHWDALLTARAIECQCYMIGVNRTGVDGNGIGYPRSSRVIDPRGAVLQPEVVADELDLYTLDAAHVAAYRRAFPTLRDRRPDTYREFRTPVV
ncbi:MAG TPA: nitrilase-related carbon-nitrogen hydrolase [Longimicrobiales bacterium]|nr:nitrilase-related carbon-nitrogen hydrolase [Longimicrobiales bacterium]